MHKNNCGPSLVRWMQQLIVIEREPRAERMVMAEKSRAKQRLNCIRSRNGKTKQRIAKELRETASMKRRFMAQIVMGRLMCSLTT